MEKPNPGSVHVRSIPIYNFNLTLKFLIIISI